MSYIAFDLDALNVCPQVGAACGLSAAEAAHGLLQLWAWCFRTEQSTATDVHVRGFFQGKDAGPALEAFGFLEKGDGWRVRGAERYLRVKEARRKGGKSAAGNLKRGTKKPGRSRGSAGTSAGGQPGTSPGSTPALTPSTEHRAPSTESEKPSPPARSRVLSDRLVATFLEKRGTVYRFASTVDGPALARLLKLPVDDDEIDRRWRIGLDGKFQQETNSIAQLDSKWNALTKADGPTRADPNGGVIRSSERCALCDAPGAVLVGNASFCYGRHLPVAEAWANEQQPDTPWLADTAKWAALQRGAAA